MLSDVIGDTSRAGNWLHLSGEFGARMMIVAMLATPLRLLFNKQRWTLLLVRHRRYFGVASLDVCS